MTSGPRTAASSSPASGGSPRSASRSAECGLVGHDVRGARGGDGVGRDLIVFVAAGVVTVTIVVHGPRPARRGAVGPAPRRHLGRRASFRRDTATEDAIATMPELAADLGTRHDVVERLRRGYDEHRQVVGADEADGEDQAVRHERQYTGCGWPSRTQARPRWSGCATSVGSTIRCCAADPGGAGRGGDSVLPTRTHRLRSDPEANAQLAGMARDAAGSAAEETVRGRLVWQKANPAPK
jgi:hypothetical protein